MDEIISFLYMHIVLPVKDAEALIDPEWEDSLHRHISSLIRSNGQTPYAVNGMADHIHIFMSMDPERDFHEAIIEIQRSSEDFIRENNLSKKPFRWDEGYMIFSHGMPEIDTVVSYIKGQKEFHAVKTFKEEEYAFKTGYFLV